MKLIRLLSTGALFFVLFFTKVSCLYGQNNRLSIDKSNIEGQFNYVLTRSDKIEDTRIVKSWQLYRLKSHVLDSLKEVHGKLVQSRHLMVAKQRQIDSLNNVIVLTNEKLSHAVKAKNNLSLLGIKMEKSGYNSIMWTLVGLLIFGLFLFIVLFKRSNVVTVQTKKKLEETQQEFEAHRKRALAREEQIVRKLYDELNKYKSKVNQRD